MVGRPPIQRPNAGPVPGGNLAKVGDTSHFASHGTDLSETWL